MTPTVRLLTSAEDLALYDRWVKSHPQGSLWQSLEWKKYQEALGREVRVYGAISDERLAVSALVVIDKTVGGLSTWDIPRGPLAIVDSQQSVDMLIDSVISDAKKNACLSLFLSPTTALSTNAYQRSTSNRHEQPEATRILDLTLTEEQLLAQMHQKGRYNINVARKNGVAIEQSQDIDAYYALAQKTGKRDAFGIPSKRQLALFLKQLPGSFLLLARKDNHIIAGLIGIMWNNRCIYYYGASDYEHRSMMAPYLLQWEAIQFCKNAGATSYDLLGIAPPDSPANHPWAGISDFKAKFGGTVMSYPPEQEITLKPMMKKMLILKRRFIG